MPRMRSELFGTYGGGVPLTVTPTGEPGASPVPAGGSVPTTLPSAPRLVVYSHFPTEYPASESVLTASALYIPLVSGTSPGTESVTVTVVPCGLWPGGGSCATTVPLFVVCCT